ncbi:MAG: hypothetical protein KDD94_06850 [Calditrichaeota bacterium]|nr:hypothetical protein [Calditrichota bacterium]
MKRIILICLTRLLIAQEDAMTLELGFPSGIVIDKKDNVIFSDRRLNKLFRLDQKSGSITVLSGTGDRSFSGDNGSAKNAALSIPEIIYMDQNGDLYICDRGNYRVRIIDAKSGMIRTVAGTGKFGYSGDGGPALAADLSNPFGVTLDEKGNIWIADTENHVIRKVDRQTGIITTEVGSGESGFSGDGGPAKQAQLQRPHVLSFDKSGDLWIGDSFNNRIRKVNIKTGIINSMFGNGEKASSPDGSDARKSALGFFGTLLFDQDGNLVFSEIIDARVRKIDLKTGLLSTLAGNGKSGFSGDAGPANKAQLGMPYGIAFDRNYNLYIADAQNGRIRRVDARTGIISTIAGNGQGD